MPQSLHCLHSHIVFSTKNRVPFLSKEVRPKIYAYMVGILNKLECKGTLIGGIEDHIHIYCNFTKKHAPIHVLEILKKDSSKWIKSNYLELQKFYWQDGYGLFSISPSHVNAVKKCVMSQEEHHKTETFQDEYRRMLKKYQLNVDERYLWD